MVIKAPAFEWQSTRKMTGVRTELFGRTSRALWIAPPFQWRNARAHSYFWTDAAGARIPLRFALHCMYGGPYSRRHCLVGVQPDHRITVGTR
jgi:hypothetical protein